MSLAPNARTNAYTTSHDLDPVTDVLSGALAATASMDDIVHASAATNPAPQPAPSVEVTPLKDGTWRARGENTHDVITAAAAQLGRIEVLSCENVTRGVGPWRRTWVEATLTAADHTAATHGEGTSPSEGLVDTPPPAAPGDHARAQIINALFPDETPTAATGNEADATPTFQDALTEAQQQQPTTSPAPAAESPGDVPAGGARLALAIAAAIAEPPVAEDPHLPRPHLREDYPQPDLSGIDIEAALTALGLHVDLAAEVATLGDGEDSVSALDLVVADALSRAGTLPESGGAVTCGVGPAGAAALVNAAHAGAPIGYLQWGQDQGEASHPRILAALLAGIRPR